MASTCGAISAADTPCTIRAVTRVAPFGAMPQASEDSANRTIPTAYMRRRPNMSPSRPPVIIATP
jgi:hypothetical protein